MNKCPKCQVELLENIARCPICQKRIIGDDLAVEQSFFPKYQIVETQSVGSFTLKLTSFISIIILGLCGIIQLLSHADIAWFVLVAAIILYAFVLVNHTIMSKVNLGFKILVQVIVVSGYLFLCDYFSGLYLWSTNVVIPLLVVGATIAIIVLVSVKKMKWNDFMRYLVSLLVLALIPAAIWLFGINSWLWFDAIATLFVIMSLVGIMLFSDRGFKSEFIRRFHF